MEGTTDAINDLPTIGRRPPECLALIICNDVIEDKLTNNKTIVGIFNTMFFYSLPFTHAFSVYAAFGEGIGDWPFSFRILNPTNKELFKADGTLNFDEKNAVAEFVLKLQGFEFCEEGRHVLEAMIGNNLSRRRYFLVQRSMGG